MLYICKYNLIEFKFSKEVVTNITIRLKILAYTTTFFKNCKYNKIRQSLSPIDHVTNISLSLIDLAIFTIF